MKIYAIQKGTYSDKHIIACTLDYEKAKKIKQIHEKTDSCVILEFEDSEEIVLPMFEVTLFDGVGRIEDVYYADYQEYEEFDFDDIYAPYAYVRAENKETALKIVQDKYAEWKAKNENII